MPTPFVAVHWVELGSLLAREPQSPVFVRHSRYTRREDHPREKSPEMPSNDEISLAQRTLTQWTVCAAQPEPIGELAHWRQRRVNVQLAWLRRPLEGIELNDRDQAVLAWLADQDALSAGTIVSLLTRARQAEPPT